jgi:hypothetical protein
MPRGHYRVARRCIIYRAKHAKMRALRGDETVMAPQPVVHVVLNDGTRVPFVPYRARKRLAEPWSLSPIVSMAAASACFGRLLPTHVNE